jgi:glycosyltransferase involved in cell wall biosynthesis
MEAAAAGRPVVAYDVRGVREVVDSASGLLVPRGDRAALTRVVEGLLRDPERCVALGRQCQARVLERFSEDDVIARLRGVYAELEGVA